MSESNEPHFPANPNYGAGCFRRRILIVQQGEKLTGLLEDTNHGFSVELEFKQHKLCAINAQTKRTPFNTCSNAIEKLDPLIGLDCKLELNSKDLNLLAGANANCTHLLDLTILAILFYKPEAVQDETPRQRQFDVMVADADAQGSDCQVFCDGKLIHQWQAKQFQITAPQALASMVLYKGFAQWANRFFSDELENQAAFVLQKGYFVAQARLYDIDALAGEKADAHESMVGACYTYQPDVSALAYRLENTTRDFSNDQTQLLKFS